LSRKGFELVLNDPNSSKELEKLTKKLGKKYFQIRQKYFQKARKAIRPQNEGKQRK